MTATLQGSVHNFSLKQWNMEEKQKLNDIKEIVFRHKTVICTTWMKLIYTSQLMLEKIGDSKQVDYGKKLICLHLLQCL